MHKPSPSQFMVSTLRDHQCSTCVPLAWPNHVSLHGVTGTCPKNELHDLPTSWRKNDEHTFRYSNHLPDFPSFSCFLISADKNWTGCQERRNRFYQTWLLAPTIGEALNGVLQPSGCCMECSFTMHAQEPVAQCGRSESPTCQAACITKLTSSLCHWKVLEYPWISQNQCIENWLNMLKKTGRFRGTLNQCFFDFFCVLERH